MVLQKSYLYIDLDHVIMDFYRGFRPYHYTAILVKKYHPLDINFKNYNENKKIKAFVDESCADSPTRFWVNLPVLSSGKFYWGRLKDYHDRIYLLTKCRSEIEREGKILWINSFLKFYNTDRIIFNSNIFDHTNSLLYKNVLITHNNKDAVKWESLGGVSVWDLNKRSVASYFLEKTIIPHLNLYSGFNYIAGIPLVTHKDRRKNKDIRSISLDDLNRLI